jgi:hypothetical protein
MKRYLAYAPGNGNSGLKTEEDARKWAAHTLMTQPKVERVLICEAREVVARTEPTLVTTSFEGDPIDSPSIEGPKEVEKPLGRIAFGSKSFA